MMSRWIFLCILLPPTGSVDECHYDVTTQWTAEIGTTPIINPPILYDIEGDGKLELITSTYSDTINIIDIDTGLSHPGWPIGVGDATFHAGPLLFDVDHDGRMEILMVSSTGTLYFFQHDGDLMLDKRYQLPGLPVHKDWYKNFVAVDRTDIADVLLLDDRSNRHDYVSVDVHILATPSIADMNQDGVTEELVVPVTYYFESTSRTKGVNEVDIQNYLACGVLVLNLTSGNILRNIPMELSRVSSDFPAYLFSTPTLVDLDGDFSYLEIVVGTAAGYLHVFNKDGSERRGFPLQTGSIHGGVTVFDVDGDGRLEMLVPDTSGNLLCVGPEGRTLWEYRATGVLHSAPAYFAANGTVVVASMDGKLHVMSASTGRSVALVELDSTQIGQVTTTQDHVVIPSFDGRLRIAPRHLRCSEVLNVDDKILTEVVVLGEQIFVSTASGALLALRVSDHRLTAAPQYSHNVGIGTPRLYLDAENDETLTVNFRISGGRSDQFTVTVRVGGLVLARYPAVSAGVHTFHVVTPSRPVQGTLTVEVADRFGRVATDYQPVRIHLHVVDELQWYILLPFIAMATTLLLLHGDPQVDLLPTTHLSKTV